MNESYRHKELLALLEERKALSTADIMQLLNISPATARRDISKLDGQGKLKRLETEQKQFWLLHFYSTQK